MDKQLRKMSTVLARLQLTLERVHPIILFSLSTLLVVVVSVSIHELYFRREHQARQLEVTKLNALLKKTSVHTQLAAPPNPTGQFYESLGSIEDLEHIHKTIHAIGAESGVTLSQTDFTFKQIPSSSIAVYEAAFPIKAHYAEVRMFIEKTLLAVPFASLSELDIKRSEFNEAAVEAQIKFKIYIDSQRKINLMGVD